MLKRHHKIWKKGEKIQTQCSIPFLEAIRKTTLSAHPSSSWNNSGHGRGISASTPKGGCARTPTRCIICPSEAANPNHMLPGAGAGAQRQVTVGNRTSGWLSSEGLGDAKLLPILQLVLLPFLSWLPRAWS